MIKLKRIITFIKRPKKIKNQNYEDRIRKYNTINLNWMIKLKTNQIFIKKNNKLRSKIKNQKIKIKIKMPRTKKLSQYS
jgi:hypothetical protein